MRLLQTLFVLLALVTSCTKPVKETVNTVAELEMYEPSEMALLMRQIYEYNKMLRNTIKKTDTVVALPEDFTGIYTLTMTDPEERDADYKELADEFLDWQQKALKTAAKDSAIVYFNKAVQTCVACHQTRCTGPIPKIKKLLIH